MDLPTLPDTYKIPEGLTLPELGGGSPVKLTPLKPLPATPQISQDTPDYEEPSFTGFFKNLGGDFVDLAKGLGHIIYKVGDTAVRGGNEWVQYLKGNRHNIGDDFSGPAMDLIKDGIHENLKTIIKSTAESYADYKKPLEKTYNHPLDVFMDAVTVMDLGATAGVQYAKQAATTAAKLGKAAEAVKWTKAEAAFRKGGIGQFLKPMAESPVLKTIRKAPLVDATLQGLHLTPESSTASRLWNETGKFKEQALDNDTRAILTSAERLEPGMAEKIQRVAMADLPEAAINTPSGRSHLELLKKNAREVEDYKVEAGVLTREQAEASTYAFYRNNLTKMELGKLAHAGYLDKKGLQQMNYLLLSPQKDVKTNNVLASLEKSGMLQKILNSEEIAAFKQAEHPRSFILKKYSPIEAAKAAALAEGKAPFYLPAIHAQHLNVADAFGSREIRMTKQAFMKARTGADGALLDANITGLVARKQFLEFQRIREFFRRLTAEPFMKDVTEDIRKGTYVPAKGTQIFSPDIGLFPFHKDIFETQARTAKAINRYVTAGEVSNDVLKRSLVDVMTPDWESRLRDGLKARGEKARAYEMPKAVGQILSRQVSQMSPLAKFIFDSPLELLRVSALYMNPMWYIGNVVGNTVLNMLSGMNPFSYFRGGAKSFAKIVPDELKNLLGAALNSGFTQAERMKRGLTSLPPFRQLGAANGAIEDFFRSAHFMDALTKEAVKRRLLTVTERLFASDEVIARKLKPLFDEAIQRGQTVQSVVLGLKDVSAVRDAIALTNKSLFDYSNLHPVERNIIRRIVPFWTFMKNINLLMLRLPVDRPMMSRAFRQVGELDRRTLSHVAIDAIDDHDLPDWLEGHVPMGTDKDGNFLFVSLRGINPFQSFGQIMDPKKLAASTNPIIKASLEYISGRDMWSKKELKSNEPVWDYSGRSFKVRLGEDGRVTLVKDVPGPGWVEQFVNQFRQVRLLRNIIDPNVSTKEGAPVNTPFMDVNGNWQYPTNVLDTALNLAGIGIKRVDKGQVAQKEMMRRVKFIKDSAKQLKDAPPEYRDFITETIRRAASAEFKDE